MDSVFKCGILKRTNSDIIKTWKIDSSLGVEKVIIAVRFL